MNPMRLFVILSLVLAAASPLQAQSRKETLADIRQELNVLYVTIQRLKQELSTTGPAPAPPAAQTELEQISALEQELQRITNKVERLEFRINRIVKDGTNRIGDLEFRLVELEGGDTSKLGETTTLGGNVDTPPVVADNPRPNKPDLAVGEEEDFKAAKAAYDAGKYQQAADLFAPYPDKYPDGPLVPAAQYWRGEALAQLGQWPDAARAFLQSFSGAPDGEYAPKALYRLGVSLDKIGQTEDACLTLKEVARRYPAATDEIDQAAKTMAALGCSG